METQLEIFNCVKWFGEFVKSESVWTDRQFKKGDLSPGQGWSEVN